MDSMPALEELGQQFMIVRERIRAIERKARTKLRKSPEEPNDDPGSTG